MKEEEIERFEDINEKGSVRFIRNLVLYKELLKQGEGK